MKTITITITRRSRITYGCTSIARGGQIEAPTPQWTGTPGQLLKGVRTSLLRCAGLFPGSGLYFRERLWVGGRRVTTLRDDWLDAIERLVEKLDDEVTLEVAS